MTYEVVKSATEADVWSVEAIDHETGDCFKTNFYGPQSRERANEYAHFKNGELC